MIEHVLQLMLCVIISMILIPRMNYNLFLSKGLKTGMYYLRSKPAASAIQFTVDKTKLKKAVGNGESAPTPNDKREDDQRRNREAMVCSLQNKDDCLMCGS